MGTLYIVGNGLDLHFNLKTRVEHFVEYLKVQSVCNEIGNAHEVLSCYGVDWCEYEQSLNEIDLDEIAYQNQIYPDYLSEHESDRDSGIFNMQMYLNSLSNAINLALKSMVDDANHDAKELSLQCCKKKLFKEGDAILSFNYTSTVEYLFNIPDGVPIFHIHGCYEQREPLIFGYKNNEESYAEKWTSMGNEGCDFYIAQQRDIVFGFYDRWKKKHKINSLRAFLNKCYGIDRIVVLGHSMGAVDFEYMEQVERFIHPISWNISYYSMEDIERVQFQGYSFQNKIRFAQIEELLED